MIKNKNVCEDKIKAIEIYHPKTFQYVKENLVRNCRCFRCGNAVLKETDEILSKEYPYQCVVCDENMYGIETRNSEKELSLEEECLILDSARRLELDL